MTIAKTKSNVGMVAFDEDSIRILSDERDSNLGRGKNRFVAKWPTKSCVKRYGCGSCISADFWCGSRFLIGASPARNPLLARLVGGAKVVS